MRERTAAGLCPFGGAQALAGISRDALASKQADTLRGPGYAASHRVWGLCMDPGHPGEVAQWIASRGLSCTPRQRQPRTLECVAARPEAVDPSWAGAKHLAVILDLAPAGFPQAVRAIASYPEPQAAADALMALEAAASRTLGGAATPHTPIAANAWDTGMLTQVRVAFHRQDVFAQLTGTQMAGHVSVQHYIRRL